MSSLSKILVLIAFFSSVVSAQKESKYKPMLWLGIIFLAIFDLACLVVLIYLCLVPPKRQGMDATTTIGTSQTSGTGSKVPSTRAKPKSPSGKKGTVSPARKSPGGDSPGKGSPKKGTTPAKGVSPAKPGSPGKAVSPGKAAKSPQKVSGSPKK